MKYHALEDPVFTGGGRAVNVGANRPVPLAMQPKRTRKGKSFSAFKARKIKEFMQQTNKEDEKFKMIRIGDTLIY